MKKGPYHLGLVLIAWALVGGGPCDAEATLSKSSKVYFTSGHGEHPINDTQTAGGYGLVVQILKGENIVTDNFNLALTGSVPADANAVVIAGPTVPFSATEVLALDKYLTANGKIFVLLDPLAQDGLEDVLKKYELSFDNDIVLSRIMNNSSGQQQTTPLAYIQQSGFSSHPIVASFRASNYALPVVDARSAHIALGNSRSPRAQALMSTGPEAWGWNIKPNTSDADLEAIASRIFDPKNDVQGPLAIAAAYDADPVTDPTTKAQSIGTRLVLVGSSHFLENDTVRGDTVGANFFINAVNWLVSLPPRIFASRPSLATVNSTQPGLPATKTVLDSTRPQNDGLEQTN